MTTPAATSLKKQIMAQTIAATKAQDKARLGVFRMLNAALKQVEVDQRVNLEEDDAGVLAIIQKMLKQRRDSISQYQLAKRDDLVKQEEFEVQILSEFLPKQLTDHEVEELIRAAIAEAGATTMQDMSKVMAILKPRMQGKADMGKVSQKVGTLLKG